MNQPRPSPAARAFVLSEMLVVLAVIIMIMALLMPALSLSRENAMSALCKSNERQTALFALNKVNENRGRFPPNIALFRAADAKTLICPRDATPALVPESAHFESSKVQAAPGKGGGGGTKELLLDLDHAIYSSYAINPEFYVYDLLDDEVPDPSDKLFVYEGYADAAAGSSGDSLTTLVSIGGEVWFDGSKVTITHLPPGNRSNGRLLSVGMPALDAHIGHDEHSDHHDLFGNWLTLGKFDAFYKISNDFVRRHPVGRPHGNIIFLDGHAEEHRAITSDMLVNPFVHGNKKK